MNMTLLDAVKRQLKTLLEDLAQEDDAAAPPLAAPPVGEAPYSHGLEKIYTLEKVDVAKIRPLSQPPGPSGRAEPSSDDSLPPQRPYRQLPLDIDAPWRCWLSPCHLEEPLRVLELSKPLEGRLRELSCHHVGDVVALWRKGLLPGMGLGQGHLDEVDQTLRSYTKGKECSQSHEVDLGAFLRRATATLEPLEALLLLDGYGLSHLYLLSEYERGKIRRREEEWRTQQAQHALERWRSQTAAREWISGRWYGILTALVAPWLRSREGVASADEAAERLSCCCKDPHNLRGVQALLRSFFGHSPWLTAFKEQDDALLFVDDNALTAFRQVELVAASYLRGAATQFLFEDLALLVARERARRWLAADVSTIKAFLWRSRRFHVFKHDDQRLWIAMAPVSAADGMPGIRHSGRPREGSSS